MEKDPLQGGNIHNVSGNRPEIQRDPCRPLDNKYQVDLIAGFAVVHVRLGHPEMDAVWQAAAVYEDVFVSPLVLHYELQVCFLEGHLLFRSTY